MSAELNPMLNRIQDKDPREAGLELVYMVRLKNMGEVRVEVKVENYEDRVLHQARKLPAKKVRFRQIDAVVDTGAVLNLLPQDLVEALGIRLTGKTIVQLANDQRVELDRAEAVRLTLAGRSTVSDCLVGPPGCTPLIGQIVLEALDLIVDPAQRTVTVRPESPFYPTVMLKGAALPAPAAVIP